MLIMSREWPENLGSGKPYEPDTRLQDYIAAHCEAQLGNRNTAENYHQQIIDFSLKHWSDTRDPANIFIATRVLDAQGKLRRIRSLNKRLGNQTGFFEGLENFGRIFFT